MRDFDKINGKFGPINRRWVRYACPPDRTARPLRAFDRRADQSAVGTVNRPLRGFAAGSRRGRLIAPTAD
ncbi:MAG TPA: hypothetical protein VFA09_07750 [Ktedonobacteraceae bacterium]|nr:hypothetical protein [Ktedonobacteraceae bacterium]